MMPIKKGGPEFPLARPNEASIWMEFDQNCILKEPVAPLSVDWLPYWPM